VQRVDLQMPSGVIISINRQKASVAKSISQSHADLDTNRSRTRYYCVNSVRSADVFTSHGIGSVAAASNLVYFRTNLFICGAFIHELWYSPFFGDIQWRYPQQRTIWIASMIEKRLILSEE
jgi:hypothetical protein